MIICAGGSTDAEMKAMFARGKFCAESLFAALGGFMRCARIDAASIEEHIEMLRLETVGRLLNCSLLNYRISGAELLVDVIRAVHEGGRGLYKAATVKFLASARYLTPRVAAHWIATHGIIDAMLGRNHHEEVVKRCRRVVVFLAQQKVRVIYIFMMPYYD